MSSEELRLLIQKDEKLFDKESLKHFKEEGIENLLSVDDACAYLGYDSIDARDSFREKIRTGRIKDAHPLRWKLSIRGRKNGNIAGIDKGTVLAEQKRNNEKIEKKRKTIMEDTQKQAEHVIDARIKQHEAEGSKTGKQQGDGVENIKNMGCADSFAYESLEVNNGIIECPSCASQRISIIACHTYQTYAGISKFRNGYTGRPLMREESIVRGVMGVGVGVALFCEDCEKYWFLTLRNGMGSTYLGCRERGRLSHERGWSEEK